MAWQPDDARADGQRGEGEQGGWLIFDIGGCGRGRGRGRGRGQGVSVGGRCWLRNFVGLVRPLG